VVDSRERKVVVATETAKTSLQGGDERGGDEGREMKGEKRGEKLEGAKE
jgi:hypothetical protein